MKTLLSSQNEKSWLRVSNRLTDVPLDTKDPKLVLAVAVGLAGTVLFRGEP
jgi:hypothetical protein